MSALRSLVAVSGGIAAAGALVTLAGCGLFNKPSAAYLNRCLSLPVSTGTNPPLSMLVRSLESRGIQISWSGSMGRAVVLTGSKYNPLNGTAQVVKFSFENADGPRNGVMECGPGVVRLTGGTIDGEALSTYAADDAVLTFIEAELRAFGEAKKASQAAAVIAPPASPTPTPSASAGQNEMMSDAEEVEDDRQHYAQLASDNRVRPIAASATGPSIGLTLGEMEQVLRSGGAKVTIDGADAGAVWLDIQAPPRMAWQNYEHIVVEFERAQDGRRLSVASIKANDANGQLLAGAGDPSIADFLGRFKRD